MQLSEWSEEAGREEGWGDREISSIQSLARNTFSQKDLVWEDKDFLNLFQFSEVIWNRNNQKRVVDFMCVLTHHIGLYWRSPDQHPPEKFRLLLF